MDLNSMLTAIPYLVPHGLDVSDETEDYLEVRMPYVKALTNHVGTLHASALFTIAETAAGLRAFRIVPGNKAIVLLRGAEVQYTRRAESDLTATARVKDGQADKACADFDAHNRADADIEVDVVDGDGETVFKGTFDYALRPGSL